jgi:hypothetical protein
VPIYNRRPLPRRVLAQNKNLCVGLWEPDAPIELAHFYHVVEDAPDALSLEHRFCYRNSYPETLVFDRSVEVRGPATYETATGSEVLELDPRRTGGDPHESTEPDPAGSLKVVRRGEVVTTRVTLTARSVPNGVESPTSPIVSTCDFPPGYECMCG